MQIRIENIETENRKQIDLWNNDSETMMNALLLRLLQGRYGDVDRTLIALGRLGVYFPYQFFIIAIIDTTCQRLCDSLTQIDDLTFESVADDRGRNVIIINMTFEQINTAHKKMEEFAINGDIERLVLGISELHEDIDKISEAYKEAMKASEYCYLYNRHISYYGSIIESQENYQYTIEDEWRIINAIIKGNSSDALKILNEIIETNMNKKVLSINMLRSLILDIDTTLVRACTIGNLSERIDPFENITKQQRLSDYQEYVSQLIDKMCKEVVKNKEDEDELYEEKNRKSWKTLEIRNYLYNI